MLSLLKNKIRNKFLQTDYIHPYIIWCIDVFLSVISSFSIFLFFHYLINISIHFNQQRYILLIAVISVSYGLEFVRPTRELYVIPP